MLDDHADYWPITPRQVLYRLMGRGQAIKADDERIGDYLVRGRRAGFIPWEAIGDGRTESAVPVVCDDPEAFFAEMRESATEYRLDRQDGQPVYIEMVVEAAGAVEQVFRTTRDYGVPVHSGSGFVAVDALRKLVLRAETRETPTVILVAGDLDPAGIDIRARVADELDAFALGHDVQGIEVDTIALDERQVDAARARESGDACQETREVPVVAARLDGRARGRVAGRPRRDRRRRGRVAHRRRYPASRD